MALYNLQISTSKSNVIIVILLLAINIVKAQEITLHEAYNIMLQNNGHIKASLFEVSEKQEEQKAAKGLRYPTLSASATYLRLENDITMDLNSTRNMVGGLLSISDPASVLGDWNFTLQEKDLSFGVVELSMPLFAGGKITNYNKATKIKVDLAKNASQLTEDELTIKLIDYYFKLKLAKELEHVRKQVYETVLLHYNQATKFYENGIIPEVETLNAKVALSNAETELKASQKDVALATTALENTIGITNITQISTNFNKPTIINSFEDFKTDVLNGNTQLKTIEKNHELAEIGMKLEKSHLYPSIGVFSNYIPYTDNLPLAENTKWMVGIGAKWEIFNGFQTEHKIKASKLKINQVEAIKKQAKLDLTTYSEKLFKTMQKELEQYESLDNNQSYAERLKFMRTRAFEEGTGTSIDVVDATLKLSEIQLKKIKALYEYNVAYGELMVLSGKTDTLLNQYQ